MSETPEIQWFEAHNPKCSCGKRATGILRGRQNQSYGPHCTACANRRIKAAMKVRAKEAQS